MGHPSPNIMRRTGVLLIAFFISLGLLNVAFSAPTPQDDKKEEGGDDAGKEEGGDEEAKEGEDTEAAEGEGKEGDAEAAEGEGKEGDDAGKGEGEEDAEAGDAPAEDAAPAEGADAADADAPAMEGASGGSELKTEIETPEDGRAVVNTAIEKLTDLNKWLSGVVKQWDDLAG